MVRQYTTLCDFYLFDGPSGKTVMAMTVNPDVRLSAPDTLHPEGLYAFRFPGASDRGQDLARAHGLHGHVVFSATA